MHMQKLASVTAAFAFAIFLVADACATVVSAQTAPFVDHWATAAECLAATSAPFYYPSVLTQRKLGGNEAIRGIPTGACVEMELPDRMGGRGFVRIESGRRFVYDRTTVKLLRLAECNNDVFKVVPFAPLLGLSGPTGPLGPQGIRGLRGEKGEKGDTGPQGAPGWDGKNGANGKDGFCSSKKCRWTLGLVGTAVVVGGIAAAGDYYCWWQR